MSSPLWSRLSDVPAVVAAVTDVAETSLYAYVDAIDAAEFAAAAAQTPAWLQTRLRFAGPVAGTFTMTLPAGLATNLASAFAGESPSGAHDDTRLLVDFAGEVGNMVCGAWLTRTCREVAFDLSAPAVVRRDVLPAVHGGVQVFVTICDAPVALHIEAGGGDATGARP